MSQDVPWPTTCMLVKCDEKLEIISMEVPHGNGCSQCVLGARRALPYMSWTEVVDTCAISEPFKISCMHFSDLCSGSVEEEVVSGNDTSEARHKDRLVALYDGHDRLSFKNAHRDISPERLGVTGYQDVHPYTKDPLTLFAVPSKVPFQLQVSSCTSSRVRSNVMPDQVYGNQPVDTEDWHSKRLPIGFRSANLSLPNRSLVEQRMAALLAETIPAPPRHAPGAVGAAANRGVSVAQEMPRASAPPSQVTQAARVPLFIRNQGQAVPGTPRSAAPGTPRQPPPNIWTLRSSLAAWWLLQYQQGRPQAHGPSPMLAPQGPPSACGSTGSGRAYQAAKAPRVSTNTGPGLFPASAAGSSSAASAVASAMSLASLAKAGKSLPGTMFAPGALKRSPSMASLAGGGGGLKRRLGGMPAGVTDSSKAASRRAPSEPCDESASTVSSGELAGLDQYQKLIYKAMDSLMWILKEGDTSEVHTFMTTLKR